MSGDPVYGTDDTGTRPRKVRVVCPLCGGESVTVTTEDDEIWLRCLQSTCEHPFKLGELK